MKLIVLLSLLTFSLAVPEDELLEVFIIPHTHDDVGWLQTVDEYYIKQVQFILDSCIQQLQDNPERKFTYVEQAYFERWWHEISPAKQQIVRQLVQNGQLEFNLGGITMNDEATTTYYEEINQMTQGAQFLKEELGAIAKSAWHVDPFGHASTTASLWSQVGFNGFVLNRVPLPLKAQMKTNKQLEFVWRSSKSLGAESDIWIHVLDTWYSSPSECSFNNNDGWNGIYIVDDPALFGVNINQIAQNFVNMARQRSSWYRHNKLLIPFGDDFAHREAYNSYVNMDKLIKYVNNNSTYNVKVKYAFLSEYVAAVNALNLTWDVFEGDFFPYQDSIQAFWSGYFTSRPLLKGYVRSSDALLNSGEQLYSIARSLGKIKSQPAFDQLEVLRQATSLATHHDAVSGTEKAAVAGDYTTRLDMGTQSVVPLISQLTSSLSEPVKYNDFDIASEAKSTLTTVSVYNSLGWRRTEYVYILTQTSDVYVVNSTGNVVPSQANPLPAWSIETGNYRLYFLVDVPPLGTNTYTIKTSNGKHCATLGSVHNLDASANISNGFLQLNFDSQSGKISTLYNTQNGGKVQLNQDLFQYASARGDSGQASGAYIFRPATNSEYSPGSSSSTSHKANSVSFAAPLSSNPYVFVSPSGQDYSDTFVANANSVNSQSFEAIVQRVDNGDGGWGQNLFLNYIAWTADTVPQNFEVGTTSVGASSSNYAKVSINFKKAYSSPPLIYVTPLVEDLADSFGVTAQAVSTTGITLSVLKITGSTGWKNLQLNWMAYSGPSSSSDPIAPLTGSVTVGSSTNQAVEVTVSHAAYAENPIILLFPRTNGVADTFAASARLISTDSFSFNVYKLNGNSWNQPINVDWILLTRKALVFSVTNTPLSSKIITGPLVQEVQQQWRAGYAQTVRLFSGLKNPLFEKRVEISHQIGIIDNAREVVTRFSTNLKNKLTIYTDDNGLELHKRVYNYTHTLDGNYYPMVARSIIRDESQDLQVTLLSDSSHGASGPIEGQLEVMLHRRCIDDDGRGVGEALNDQTVIQPELWVVFENAVQSAELHRRQSIHQQFPLTISTVGLLAKPYTALQKDLPYNVHLLNLRAFDATSNNYILRLQHIFEVDEHPIWSKPAQVDLKQLFAAPLVIQDVTELNLSANQPKDSVQRLNWRTKDNFSQKQTYQPEVPPFVVTLNPMQIRTFSIQLGSSL